MVSILTGQTPADLATGASGRWRGFIFSSTSAFTVTHLRHYSASGDETATGRLMEGETVLAAEVFTGLVADQWNDFELDVPIECTAETDYVVAVHTVGGDDIEFTQNGLSGGLTNETFTIPVTGGRFRVSTTASGGAIDQTTNDLFFADIIATVEGGAIVTGTGLAALGALAATAAGTRTVSGTAAASLGALVGTAAGTRRVAGLAAAALGTLTGTATGQRTVNGVALASLGTLTGAAAGLRTVHGVALAALGGLTATANSEEDIVPGTLTATQAGATLTATAPPATLAATAPTATLTAR